MPITLVDIHRSANSKVKWKSHPFLCRVCRISFIHHPYLAFYQKKDMTSTFLPYTQVFSGSRPCPAQSTEKWMQCQFFCPVGIFPSSWHSRSACSCKETDVSVHFSPLDCYRRPLSLYCMQGGWTLYPVLLSFVTIGQGNCTCAILVTKNRFCLFIVESTFKYSILPGPTCSVYSLFFNVPRKGLS